MWLQVIALAAPVVLGGTMFAIGRWQLHRRAHAAWRAGFVAGDTAGYGRALGTAARLTTNRGRHHRDTPAGARWRNAGIG